MALRIPPGRAGRIWLVARLQAARHGAELLDRKRQALAHRQAQVHRDAEDARRVWRTAAAQATLWSTRAALLDGAARLELLAGHVQGEASLEVSVTNVMGAQLPVVGAVDVGQAPQLSALGASSAAVIAARACAEATHAAARCAAAERAEAELASELARASRRLRALEQRLIPQHEQALARLDLTLDENQREQAARVRWLTRRQEGDTL
ncbi:MAG TPA: V-type ATP synthase subunit D [Solirubrobacteraceae bacterium]|nr:V-type ATP synthase subunit D [Solirubrobacteraceae bacterium]